MRVRACVCVCECVSVCVCGCVCVYVSERERDLGHESEGGLEDGQESETIANVAHPVVPVRWDRRPGGMGGHWQPLYPP